MVDFGKVPQVPDDPILGLNIAFKADPSPAKVNLGVGAYRDNTGLPIVFEAVKKAEASLLKKLENGEVNKEYLGSVGLTSFNEAAAHLLLGPSRVNFSTHQSIGGTGAIRLGFEFCKIAMIGFDASFPKEDAKVSFRDTTVWVSKPTWPNHHNVALDTGFSVKEYVYLRADTLSVDEEDMVASIDTNVRKHDIVLLHAIGHNPTGADPSPATMMKIFKIIEDREAICLMDIAYQGFVSGCLETDRINVKNAVEHFPNMNLIVTQSFSKNMGMYGERLGAIHINAKRPDNVKAIVSQVNSICRRIYSNPPRHPADIGHLVITEHADLWKSELKAVADRINTMREALKSRLDALCPSSNWDHITKQKGMFAYTGLRSNEVKRLRDKYHLFMTTSGRISVAGLNEGNLESVVQAIAAVRNDEAAKI